jgi:SAM-dependent methyltransferase
VHHTWLMMNRGSIDRPEGDDGLPTASCSACLGPLGRRFVVREQMFGTLEAFSYGECRGCRSLRLLDVPADLAPYYPPEYYSKGSPSRYAPTLLAKAVRARLAAEGYDNLARAVGLGRPFPAWPLLLRDFGIDSSARVLDVGSGAGRSLEPLKLLGFRNLLGIDAFVESGIYGGIRIENAPLDEVAGRFDVVMLHHALEHVHEPSTTLLAIRKILEVAGVVLIRMPVADCAAWRLYGADWVALDAPRHLHVISERGCRLLAASTGFSTSMVVYDSDEFQFWGSEQYRRGISLHDRRSWAVSRLRSPFTRSQISKWRHLATELNEQRQGDSALYVLKPAS